MVYQGASEERSDLQQHLQVEQGDEPRIEVLLRNRSRSSDNFNQVNIFVAQDAIHHANTPIWTGDKSPVAVIYKSFRR